MTTMPAPPNLLLDGVESELREVAAQAYAMHAPELDQILASMRGVEAHFERVQTLMGQGTTMENVVGRIVEQ